MTRTELLNIRRKEKIPDISYDLDKDGYVWIWGYNYYYKLTGEDVSVYNYAKRLEGDSDFEAFMTGVDSDIAEQELRHTIEKQNNSTKK